MQILQTGIVMECKLQRQIIDRPIDYFLNSMVVTDYKLTKSGLSVGENDESKSELSS